MTALELPANRRADISQATAVEQARAVAEVAAAVRVAQDNPRNEAQAFERMRQACHTKALAERAFYSLPRAGGRIEGSTVHLARELARCWGNVDHGVRELRRDDTEGISEMQAWAWDQETNVRASRSFIVPHDRMVGKGADKKRERLIDLGDIANNNNSVAARAVRETIKQILPAGLVAEAEDLASQTLRDGGGKTLPQQVADAVGHFRDVWNVTPEQLEERLERKSARWTVQDLAVLRVLSGELSRGEKRVEDEFPAESKRVTVAEISAAAKTTPEASGEQPASATSVEPINESQRRKAFALYNTIGITDRDERLADASAWLKRDLKSFNDLGRDEAKALIDRLETIVADEPRPDDADSSSDQ